MSYRLLKHLIPLPRDKTKLIKIYNSVLQSKHFDGHLMKIVAHHLLIFLIIFESTYANFNKFIIQFFPK